MSIKFPEQLNIIIRTSIPGFQEIYYKPSMTIKDTNEKGVIFNPLFKLNESIVNSIPQEYRIKEFFNKGLFQSLLNYTRATPAKNLIQATRYGYVDNNINVTLNSIFPVGSVIYIDNKPYVIADHQWTTGDWKIKGNEAQLRQFPNSVIVGNNYSGPPVIIPEASKTIPVPSTRPVATAPSIIQSATSAAKKAAKTVTTTAQTLASPEKRAETARNVAQTAQTAAERATNAAQEAAETATNAAQTATNAAQTAAERATNAAQTATNALQTAAETATNAAQTAAERATNAVQAASQTATETARTASETAQAAAQTTRETIQTAAQIAAEKAKTATQTVLALTNASPEVPSSEVPSPEVPSPEVPTSEVPSSDSKTNKLECKSEGIDPVKCNNKKDYIKQARIFHPDKNPGCVEDSNKKMQKLNNLCLSDDSSEKESQPKPESKSEAEPKAYSQPKEDSERKPESVPKQQTKSTWFNFNPFKRGGSTSKNKKNKNNKTKKIFYPPKPSYVVVIDMELHPGTSLTPKELYESKCNSRYNAIRKALSEFTGTPYVIPPVYTHKTSQTKKSIGGKKNKITRKTH
jgi:hypothetical protein